MRVALALRIVLENPGSPGFNPNASKTFAPFPGASFNITYSDGEVLLGPVGVDNVTIGGLCVEKQVVPIPTHAAYLGDGINSGIIGLSFPGGTTVFNTTDPRKASKANQIIYSPLFLSAVEQKKVKNPYFSIALDRGSFEQEEQDTFDPNLGFLAFGGIAPVPVLKNSVTVPIQGFSTTQTVLPGSNLFFYTVDVDSYTFPGSDKVVTANNNTVCITGTQDGGADQGGNVFILGDVFLHNVVTTFNPVDGEVIITQRAPY
ncbi:aspartic peptidase domain-containing protein [Mycena olivaceomarginata]|nr:aspartic peptidase domain-containing protein [Mycena olivaceomarginata]